MTPSHPDRLLTGLVLLAVVLLAAWYLPPSWMAVLFALALLVVAWEWSRMLYQVTSIVVLQTLMVAVIMLALFQVSQSVAFIWLLLSSLVWWTSIFILIAVWHPFSAESSSLKWFFRLGVLPVVPSAWLALLELHRSGFWDLLYVILLVAAADTAAFYAGHKWGRRKLAATLSPGKTLVGFWAAMGAVLLLAVVSAWFRELSWLNASSFILASLIAGLLSVMGDLAESMIKRCANRKNSGHLLPGHGGAFDRLDSLLAAAPIFFLIYKPPILL